MHRIAIDGYTDAVSNVDIEYGSAFHEFIATYRKYDEPLNLPYGLKAAQEYFTTTPHKVKDSKKWMTTEHLVGTCMGYNNTYIKDSLHTLKDREGNAMVELKFAVPYYADDKYDIILCGTIDDICRVNHNGMYLIRDYKTTSVWNKASYLDAYRLSPQLAFYLYVLKRYAMLYPSSIFAEIVSNNHIGTLIDGIFLTQKESTFQRSSVFTFSDTYLKNFEFLIDQKIKQLLDVLNGVSPLLSEGTLNGSCEEVFGHCSFFAACSSPDEISEELILKHNFIQKEYNPLNYKQ